MNLLFALLMSVSGFGVTMTTKTYIATAHDFSAEQVTLSMNGQRTGHLNNGIIKFSRRVTGVAQYVEMPEEYCFELFGEDACKASEK